MSSLERVHLVGMGWLGSILAWHLHQEHIPFTWEDNDATWVAWRASTGMVYPTGDAYDMENYDIWRRWAKPQHAPWDGRLCNNVELGSFWFCTKSPPNNGKYKIAADLGAIRMAELPSIHVNVPAFVEHTRMYFGFKRLTVSPDDTRWPTRWVIAHGYSPQRFSYADWGWSARVHLYVDHQVERLSPHRPTFYLRDGRFQLNYANVLPSSLDLWLAGSAHRIQREPHMVKRTDHILPAWREAMERLSGGLVVAAPNATPIVQGWRPVEAPTGAALGKPQWIDQKLYLPPMGGNGVRHAPLLCRQALDMLKAL